MIINNLQHTGEEVKAKNKKHLTRARKRQKKTALRR